MWPLHGLGPGQRAGQLSTALPPAVDVTSAGSARALARLSTTVGADAYDDVKHQYLADQTHDNATAVAMVPYA